MQLFLNLMWFFNDTKRNDYQELNPEKQNAKKWLEIQGDVLITKGVSLVIKVLRKLKSTKKLTQLLNYFQKNEQRIAISFF